MGSPWHLERRKSAARAHGAQSLFPTFMCSIHAPTFARLSLTTFCSRTLATNLLVLRSRLATIETCTIVTEYPIPFKNQGGFVSASRCCGSGVVPKSHGRLGNDCWKLRICCCSPVVDQKSLHYHSVTAGTRPVRSRVQRQV